MPASYTAERKAGTVGPVASFAVTPASNCTTGSTLILFVVYLGVGGVNNLSSVADTKSNTWATDVVFTDGFNAGLAICSSYQAAGLTTSDTITVTLSTTLGGCAYWLEEFAGNYSVRDVSATAVTASSTTLGTGTTTATTAADELAVCLISCRTAATITKNASYTLFTTGQQNGGNIGDPWYRILAATGTQNGNGTASTMANAAGAIATYKAGAAPTVTKKPRVLSSRVAAFRAALR